MRWHKLSSALVVAAVVVAGCGDADPDLTAATVPAGAPATSVHIHEDGEVYVHTADEKSDHEDHEGHDTDHDGHTDHEMGAMSAGTHEGHDHSATREAADGLPVPAISVEVLADPMSGWNLRTVVENFRLAPENVSTDHVDGEGHMHLYIDGVKISRLYGMWYHLGQLEPGEREIRVELSANDHAAMTYEGNIIDDTVIVTVPAS